MQAAQFGFCLENDKQEIHSGGHPGSRIIEALQWHTANNDYTLIRKILFGREMRNHRMLWRG